MIYVISFEKYNSSCLLVNFLLNQEYAEASEASFGLERTVSGNPEEVSDQFSLYINFFLYLCLM